MATSVSRAKIWLIGKTMDKFNESKLPSRGEVLKVLFEFHSKRGLNLMESVNRTVEMILLIWDRAKIPTKSKTHTREKVRKLHNEWQILRKGINRNNQCEEQKRKDFQESMNDLFDIAHQNALSMIKIAEDREFLAAQREKGRRGSMIGIDKKLKDKEGRTLRRLQTHQKRVEREGVRSTGSGVVQLEDSSTSEEEGPPHQHPPLL